MPPSRRRPAAAKHRRTICHLAAQNYSLRARNVYFVAVTSVHGRSKDRHWPKTTAAARASILFHYSQSRARFIRVADTADAAYDDDDDDDNDEDDVMQK